MPNESAAPPDSRLPPLLQEAAIRTGRRGAETPGCRFVSGVEELKRRGASSWGRPGAGTRRMRAGSCRSAGRRERGLAVTRPRPLRALHRQIRGGRCSYRCIQPRPLLHERRRARRQRARETAATPPADVSNGQILMQQPPPFPQNLHAPARAFCATIARNPLRRRIDWSAR